MANNERSIENGVDNVINGLKETKKFAKSVDNKYKEAKNSVAGGINSMKNWFSDTSKKIDNKINNAVLTTRNTYSDVSNSVKSSIDTGWKNTKEIAKQSINYAETKVKAYEDFKQKLIIDSAKGIIKGITITRDTGIMVVDYGTKKVNVFVGSAKQEIVQLKNEITKGSITAISYAKNTPEVAINIAGKTIKKSLSSCVAAGIIIFKGGKFIVNANIKLAEKAVNETTEAGTYIAKKTIEAKDKVVNKTVQLGNLAKTKIVNSVKEVKNDVVSTINNTSDYVQSQVNDVIHDGRQQAADFTKNASESLADISKTLEPIPVQNDNNLLVSQ